MFSAIHLQITAIRRGTKWMMNQIVPHFCGLDAFREENRNLATRSRKCNELHFLSDIRRGFKHSRSLIKAKMEQLIVWKDAKYHAFVLQYNLQSTAIRRGTKYL
jgi:hypothetical protein